MTQTENSSLDPPALPRSARLAWLLLILATLYVCYFHNLGAIGLVGPDEPRYAWIARAMVESSDWVTPRLYGKPWFEKPVLYYWGAALSFKCFGVSEAAARLPSAIAALLATLALAWLALRLYGAETARWLLLLLPTTVGMIGFSHAAATDMPFAAMLTIAMVCAARLLGLLPSSSPSLSSFTSSTSFTSLLFGFFLGLAVLSKGPAALVLSGGAILLWAVFTKRWRETLRCLHPVAIASFCATALPWYVLCAHRNPDFFRVFIIEHNFKRYLTPEFQHIQPFWFYVPILLLAVFPWTCLLLATLYTFGQQLKKAPQHGAILLFLGAWTLFPILFFSLSKSKLPGYILPVIPPLALLLARGMSLARSELRRVVLASCVLSCAAFASAALVLFRSRSVLPMRVRNFQPELTVLFAGLGVVFALITISLAVRKSRPLFELLIPSGFAFFLFVLFALSSRNAMSESGIEQVSTRELAEFVRSYGGSPENLRLVRVNRSAFYQLNFYFGAELKQWDGTPRDGELLLGHSISCSGLGLANECSDLWGYVDRSDDWLLLRISSKTTSSARP